MKIAAALRELIAAGVTGDALVTAIERIEEASNPKRSNGAERTARWREKKKQTDSVTSDVCDVTTVTTSQPASSLSTLEAPSTLIAKKEVGASGERPQRGRGHPLPDSFEPNEGHYAVAEQLRGRRKFADECCTEMREWAKANGNRAITRKADWDMTLLTWIRRTARAGPRGVNGQAPRPGSKEDNRERTAQTLRQLDEYLDAHPDDEESSREAGQDDARLLPFAKPA